ncbi:2-dehydro-3-deoxy-phosphogluconate aldolase [Cetobacterium sp.]|uniref:2-dehydro-3-deoxy-phosphogluconate aldolase n=1 Tax=Cetobacterium sp. TaxID=2071632 RepID=UPI002633EA25|nr:KDGP aldolase family protein [uncultured Cetobacterium sp.]
MNLKANFLNNKVCLNLLAKDIKNAKDIYDITDGHVLVGVLSKNYSSVEEAVADMEKYAENIDNCISIGLGGGDPKQWRMVADICKKIKPKHVNQVFTGVGYSRANLENDETIINSLVSPCGKVGFVKISTGPLSKDKEDGIIPIETAIAMIKDMGGSSIKYFPMEGLKYKEEYIAVCNACAKENFILEPTGGIDLDNFKEIVEIPLKLGVEKVIPHVYTSIIDSKTKETKLKDVEKIYEIMKELTAE